MRHEVTEITDGDIPGFDMLDRDIPGAIAAQARRFSAGICAPLSVDGDRAGRRLQDGIVHMPPGLREALDRVRGGGWTGLDCAEAFGDQDLPKPVATALGKIRVSGNWAFNIYRGLTQEACSTSRTHGTEARTALSPPRRASCDRTATGQAP